MNDHAVVGERRLRAAGKRITPQRKLVLAILAASRGHLDAYDIHKRGRHRDPNLSLSTVYRTLNVLKETGVVSEVHLDTEHHHYELRGADEHAHLVCQECGRVIEVDSAVFAEAVKLAGEANQFEIARTQVELTGYCCECQQRLKDTADRPS